MRAYRFYCALSIWCLLLAPAWGDDAKPLRDAGHHVALNREGKPERLTLAANKFAPGQLALARGLSTLLHVDANGIELGDADVAQLAAISSLRSLNLKQARLAKGAIASLAGLTNLDSLDLTGANVDAAELRSISALPNLRRLILEDTQIGDDAEEILKTFVKLKTLNLMDTKLSPQAAQRVKQALPRVDVRFGWTVKLKEVDNHLEIVTPVATFVMADSGAQCGLDNTARVELFGKRRPAFKSKFEGIGCSQVFDRDYRDMVFRIAKHTIRLADNGKVLQINDERFEFNNYKRTFIVPIDGKPRIADWMAVPDARKGRSDGPLTYSRKKLRAKNATSPTSEVGMLGEAEASLERTYFVLDLCGYPSDGKGREDWSEVGATLVFDGIPLPSLYYSHSEGWCGHKLRETTDRERALRPKEESKRLHKKSTQTSWYPRNYFVYRTEKGFELNIDEDDATVNFEFSGNELVVHAKHTKSGIAVPSQKITLGDPSQKIVIKGMMKHALDELDARWEKLQREAPRAGKPEPRGSRKEQPLAN